MQVIDSQTRRPSNVEVTDGAMHVHMDNSTSEAVQATANALGAPDDAAATSDGGTWRMIALIKRLLAKIPALAPSGRVPVEAAAAPVISSVVSLSGLAAGVTAYSSVIDLGNSYGGTLITAIKASGANQGDAVFIQQSADFTFNTPVYCVGGNKNLGAAAQSWTNGSGANCVVTAIPALRYVRAGVTCLSGGSAQPSTSQLITAAIPGGV